jgi:thiol-disulfide isomerase/thioredoxin
VIHFPGPVPSLRASLSAAFLLIALPATPPPTPDPRVEAEYQTGLHLLARQKADEAREAFRRADQLAGGSCFRCLEGLAAAESRRGDYPGAIDASKRAEKAARTPEESARAANQLGLALSAGKDTDRGQLAEAEAAFRSALQSDGKLTAVIYNLASVLLKEGKTKEGLARLDDFLRLEPEGPRAALARTLRRSPHRFGEPLAPDFTVTTLKGDKLSLAGLGGKVVLMDFWATWCEPCRLALPELKTLQAQMRGEPFALVSCSADTNGSMLRNFVDKEQMTWAQFWDQDRALARTFSVTSYPSYYLIDPDGVVIATIRGWSPKTGDEIARQVRQAVTAARSAKRKS